MVSSGRYTELALAGLLHDIGKFWQRAAAGPGAALGPGYEGFDAADFGAHGAHATWSAAYVARYVPSLGVDYSPVLYHHRPNHPDAARIALADRLASGERISRPEAHPQRTQAVFSGLGAGTPEAVYLPLEALSLAAIAPGALLTETNLPDDATTRAAYERLWADFAAASEGLHALEDTDTLLSAVYHLLERFTWSVPAAYYRSVPDISLFDHSRVTAAVAACLADIPDATVDELLAGVNARQPDDHTPIAYLLEGDISGVQRFIYTITARGAASALRGRSFYLQLLTDAIARYVLRGLGLPLSNLIYAGGGHFYMLIPAAAGAIIADIQRDLDAIMLTHHQGDLYVGLGLAELTAADFRLEAFGATWRAAGEDVSAAKRRRFAGLAPHDLMAAVFEPGGAGGDAETECAVCHYDGPDVRAYQHDADAEPVRKCALCASLEALGHELRHATGIALLEIEPQPAQARDDWSAILADLGLAVALDTRRGWTSLSRDAHAARGVWLGFEGYPEANAVSDLAAQVGCPVAGGLRFTVNVMPLDGEARIASFSDLQESAQGLKRLGVLRMDVDDLGQLFIRGFQDEARSTATLARVAGLSAALARYFEGWVGALCRRMNAEAQREGKPGVIYSVYSGGDDVFIVGAWSAMPELALDISHDLGRYAGENPLVHLSGGLTLHGGKEPLYQAAEMAESALEAAKAMPGKNAFTLFGQTYRWEDVALIRQESGRLADLVVQHSDVGRSLLHFLLELHAQYEDIARHQQTRDGRAQVVWGPYMWRGVYQMARLAERSKEAKPQVRALMDDLSRDDFQHIREFGLAARWAEALTRK